MQMTTLGRSGLRVSRIALGTWQLGGDWGEFDEEAAIATIRRALDLGVNLFDTAQAYGFGASERLVGRALADVLRTRRDDVVIATKGGLRPADGRLLRDASPDWLRRGVEESLDALGIDVVDLYQVHWPDPGTPPADTARALQAMVDEGLIRHVGVSNYDVHQMRAFAETRPVETLQPPYHLFRREIEQEVLPYTREADVGVLVYGALAHGMLTGAMDESTTFPEGDWRGVGRDFRGETFRRNLAVVDRLAQVADARGVSLAQLAIAWTLANPAVDVTIVGARRTRHLEESLAAADIALTEDELARIDEIMADAMPVHGATPEGV
jgi:aryl-alcohol dehydrogenase-like predicted oxidoreductase